MTGKQEKKTRKEEKKNMTHARKWLFFRMHKTSICQQF